MNEKQKYQEIIYIQTAKIFRRVHDNIQKQTPMFGNLIRFW